MTRIVLSLVVCLILSSNAHAVRLTDGEAIGQLFGYTAACARNVGINPPMTEEDKSMMEKYIMWLKKNNADGRRIFNDLQTNVGMGMANAARDDYHSCEATLREMIEFYEFFKLKGTSYYPVLEKYVTVKETDGLLAFDREQSKFETQGIIPPTYTLGKYAAPEGATGELKLYTAEDSSMMINITTSSTTDGSSCEFFGLCIVTDDKIECDNLEDDPYEAASLMGTISKKSINFTSGNIINVCDRRGSMFGVYKLSKAFTQK